MAASRSARKSLNVELMKIRIFSERFAGSEHFHLKLFPNLPEHAMEVRDTKNDDSGTSLLHLSPEGKVRVLTHIQRERETANDYVKLLGGEAKRPLLLFCPPCRQHTCVRKRAEVPTDWFAEGSRKYALVLYSRYKRVALQFPVCDSP